MRANITTRFLHCTINALSPCYTTHLFDLFYAQALTERLSLQCESSFKLSKRRLTIAVKKEEKVEFNLVKTNTSTGFQQRGALFKYKGQKKKDNFLFRENCYELLHN